MNNILYKGFFNFERLDYVVILILAIVWIFFRFKFIKKMFLQSKTNSKK